MAFSSYGYQAPSFTHAHESHLPSLYPSQLGASPPGQMDTSGYLPPFLLGSPTPKSPSRMRPPSQLSTGLTPGLQGLRTSSTTRGSLNHSNMGVGGGRGGAGKSESKSLGGPPVQGLYDQPASPDRTRTHLTTASPERRQLNFSGVLNTAHRGAGASTPTTLRPRANSTPGTVGSLNISTLGAARRTPPSPAQMDPFYMQGESLTSEDDYHDCWVTIFGFPPAASSYILEQFSQYGTILKHVVTSSGNWMHILYQSRLQAKKALSKNGKVYGNGIMVGVQPCIDKSIIEGYTVSSSDEVSGISHFSSSSTTPSTPSKRPSTIRPLTAAYQASSSQNQVAPSNPNTPQKSTGFFSKALEYMFGW